MPVHKPEFTPAIWATTGAPTVPRHSRRSKNVAAQDRPALESRAPGLVIDKPCWSEPGGVNRHYGAFAPRSRRSYQEQRRCLCCSSG